jgi:hypothetical protein
VHISISRRVSGKIHLGVQDCSAAVGMQGKPLTGSHV